MKDPVRLLHGGEASERERRLLAACASEEPPGDGPARLAIALGLGASAALSQAPAAAASQASTAASLAPGASKLALPWMITWLSGGALLGAGALLYTLVHEPAAEPTTPRATPTPAPAVSQPEVTQQRASEGTPAPELDAPSAQSRSTSPSAQGRSTSPSAQGRSTSPSAQGRSIAREIAELDAVRALLGKGKGRAAIAALDDYAQRHPGGVLRQEAQVLRVEALIAGGELTPARRLGERFLRDNPSSPHGARIRALLDGADGRP